MCALPDSFLLNPDTLLTAALCFSSSRVLVQWLVPGSLEVVMQQ
jgi:hypothetical protein